MEYDTRYYDNNENSWLRADGRETHGFELTAITEPAQYACDDQSFILYAGTGSPEYTRTATADV